MEHKSKGLILGFLAGAILISGLGEIVFGDLEVRGNLSVAGNITAVGNITGENVFLKTHAFGATNITQTVALVDTWYTINWSYTHLDGSWTGNSTHMVVVDYGHYNVCYGASILDASAIADSHNAIRVNINGLEMNHSYIELDLLKQNADEWLSHCVLDIFQIGDAVSIQYISSDTDVTIESHGTYSSIADFAFASMNRIA